MDGPPDIRLDTVKGSRPFILWTVVRKRLVGTGGGHPAFPWTQYKEQMYVLLILSESLCCNPFPPFFQSLITRGCSQKGVVPHPPVLGSVTSSPTSLLVHLCRVSFLSSRLTLPFPNGSGGWQCVDELTRPPVVKSAWSCLETPGPDCGCQTSGVLSAAWLSLSSSGSVLLWLGCPPVTLCCCFPQVSVHPDTRREPI